MYLYSYDWECQKQAQCQICNLLQHPYTPCTHMSLHRHPFSPCHLLLAHHCPPYQIRSASFILTPAADHTSCAI